MADHSGERVNRRALVTVGGAALIAPLVASPVQAQDLASGAPDGPSILNELNRTGSNFVDDAERTAFRAAAKVGDTYCNVKVRYGLNGNGLASDGARIQQALDTEPAGTTMYFPQGTYVQDGGSFEVTKLQNIVGDGALTLFRGDYAAREDRDIFSINIADAGGNGDTRRWLMEGVTCFVNGAGGRYAVAINAGAAPGFVLHACTLRRCGLAGKDLSVLINGATGYIDSSFNTIEHCTLQGSVKLIGVADGNRIVNNEIIGPGCGVVLDLALGAFNTLIQGNAIVTKDGSLQIINGSFVHFLDNQCEQQNATNSLSMMVKIGAAAGSRYTTKHCQFLRNNFGGGVVESLAQTIRLDDARGCVFDQNQFNPSNQRGDIVFGPAAHYNTVGPNNHVRGPRSAVDPAWLAGESRVLGTDATRRLVIHRSPAAKGNRGIWWPRPALQNAWVNDVMEYLINGEGEVCLSGGATAGTFAPGTLICTLPSGARPLRTTYIPVGTTTGAGTLKVAGNGEVTVVDLPQADFDASGQRFRGDWIDDYDGAPY